VEFCLQIRVTPLRLAPCRTGLLSYRRHLHPLVSYTKAVALDGAESDPSSVLCYRVATFGGENTGNNVMGQRFIACPLYLQLSHGEQKLSARISKTNYGLSQISIPYVDFS